jgi:hypothetical protein
LCLSSFEERIESSSTAYLLVRSDMCGNLTVPTVRFNNETVGRELSPGFSSRGCPNRDFLEVQLGEACECTPRYVAAIHEGPVAPEHADADLSATTFAPSIFIIASRLRLSTVPRKARRAGGEMKAGNWEDVRRWYDKGKEGAGINERWIWRPDTIR